MWVLAAWLPGQGELPGCRCTGGWHGSPRSAIHGFFWRAECPLQESLLAAYCYSDFLWESAEQKLNREKEKDESGGKGGEAEERWKTTSVKELWGRRNGKQRQNIVRAQLTRVSLNMLGVLYLSISAGWNWLLFYSIPSEEASPVLVLSNWRVMSVTIVWVGNVWGTVILREVHFTPASVLHTVSGQMESLCSSARHLTQYQV